MPSVDLSEVKLRDLNAALHRLPKDTNETHWSILNPGGKHSIAAPAVTKPPKPSAAARRIERQREQKARAGQKRAEVEIDAATRALTRAQAAEAHARETLAGAEANVRAAEKAVIAARQRRISIVRGL